MKIKKFGFRRLVGVALVFGVLVLGEVSAITWPDNPIGTAVGGEIGSVLSLDIVNDRVGVGVAAPAYSLDVLGDINFTGNLTKDGVVVGVSGGGAFENASGVVRNTGANASDDFVFGSSQLDDIAGSTDDDARMFFDKSKGAFRVGVSYTSDWDDVNVGDYSVAMGDGNIATGNLSFVMGQSSTASGDLAIAMGKDAVGSGISSVAIGGAAASGVAAVAIGGASASGDYSTAIGIGSTSESRAETVIGTYDTGYTPNSATAWDAADRLFVIGNGADDGNRSDAIVVLKNGNVGIGSSAPSYDLDVVGNINFTGNLTQDGVAFGGGGSLWTQEGTGIHYSGDVGVGTITPSGKFDVVIGAYVLQANEENDPGLSACACDTDPFEENCPDSFSTTDVVETECSDTSDFGWNRYKVENISSFVISNDGTFVFRGSDPLHLHNNVERVRITPDGLFGIGTDTPAEKLDVVGNIKASGTICDSVGCIGDSTGVWTESESNISYNAGNVGIGTTASATTKLKIINADINSAAVFGQGVAAGIQGKGTGSDGVGVFGEGGSGFYSSGVMGSAVDGSGVFGSSENNSGVYGASVEDIGVFGSSENWVGVYGESISGFGVMGYSPYLSAYLEGSVMSIGSPDMVIGGSIDPTNSTDVYGVGTVFYDEIFEGDKLVVSGETRTVVEVVDYDHLIVDSPFSDNDIDNSPIRLPAKLVVVDDSYNVDFVVDNDGHVGIGTAAPDSNLDVNGKIKMTDGGDTGTTTCSNAGEIKFSGVNFYGCNGTSWVQLDN